MDTKTINHPYKYCPDLNQYKRRKTVEVNIGGIPMGGNNPIRVQSMTTIDTMDTAGSVEQCIRMAEAGCEYIRITAPSKKEALNLGEIKKELQKRGYNTPLVADIHFTPNAAEIAAKLVDKVRINPGNYVDKKRFEFIAYDDAAYEEELKRIREKFTPLVEICKEHGTAMRIGTNHGSLSDRILSRYGDTPIGMVESALEFLRICDELDYHQIVLSMKASNTQVMVQAYRLLVQKMEEEGLQPYPLHLGVTEAGEGEDGRIKSAVGIGTLLEDGLGDTIRVSLTEEPEAEAPVAQALIDRYNDRAEKALPINSSFDIAPKDPFSYQRRQTELAFNIGEGNVPRVLSDFSHIDTITVEDLKAVGHFYLPATDKWAMNDHGTDYIYTGKNKISFMLPNGVREIVDFSVWNTLKDGIRNYPMCTVSEFLEAETLNPAANFVKVSLEDLTEEFLKELSLPHRYNVVLVLTTSNAHGMAEQRAAFFRLFEKGLKTPVVINRTYESSLTPDDLQLYSATDCGGLLIDGWGDGIFLRPANNKEADKPAQIELAAVYNSTAFNILQAARTRMTKTEYISCPSCGRTLFDLQETTAMIRKRTDHLKGVKIGIMGCIVNGPGEMADADYGYVGSGKGKITLYRGQEVVKKSVPSEDAVDQLIELIREDGKWLEPEVIG